ncbi:hypothetical protein CDAR_384361 [Caerostris darwini]|uniref:Uncharacterized protein n=1 Tax=Caerostris darwini TaxID=1538125 RepID=A0AAV4M4F1_9ARAC|nr:hypothetical protein CDAR_384361 [Caerostris darwini]
MHSAPVILCDMEPRQQIMQCAPCHTKDKILAGRLLYREGGFFIGPPSPASPCHFERNSHEDFHHFRPENFFPNCHPNSKGLKALLFVWRDLFKKLEDERVLLSTGGIGFKIGINYSRPCCNSIIVSTRLAKR